MDKKYLIVITVTVVAATVFFIYKDKNNEKDLRAYESQQYSRMIEVAHKSFMDSRVHVMDAVALAETQGLGKSVIDAFLEGEDVDFTHNPGDGPQIGTLDTSGNGRRSVFALSPGMEALIVGSSDFGGTGKGSCEAWVSHPNGSKTYYLLIDEVNNITSFPGI